MTYSLFDGYENNTNPSILITNKKLISLDGIYDILNKYIIIINDEFTKGNFDNAVDLVIKNRDPFMLSINKIRNDKETTDYIDILLIFISISYDLLSTTIKKYLSEHDKNKRNEMKLSILDDKKKLLTHLKKLSNVSTFNMDQTFTMKQTLILKPEIEIYMERYPHLIKMGIFDKLKINDIKNELKNEKT